MTRRAASLWLTGFCTTEHRRARAADVFDIGMQVGRAEAGKDFADGLKVGVSLATRIAAGDVDLAEQLRQMLGCEE